jgi:PAS domain S-box-containing protein
VIGTIDDQLLIDRVGRDAEALLGYQPSELLGRSILSFVEAANVPDMLGAFAAALRTQRAVFANIAVRSKHGRVLQCDAVVVPLVPAPSTAFALLPEEPDLVSAVGRSLIKRLWSGTDTIDLSSDLATAHAEAEVPGISALTTREREIVRGLLSGDRVGAIAGRLFLSQSTIRSHLSSIYGKLGVRTQQQLVDLFRLNGGRFD